MNRLLALLTVGLVAGVALADVPPPKGQKRITIDHKIATDKEIGDYAFYTLIGRDEPAAVKFDPKTPIVVKGAGRGGIGRIASLVAVPKNAGKNYGTEKEFLDAIKSGKVDGQVTAKTQLPAFTVVRDTDKREVIVMEHTFEKIDAKEGIVLKTKAEPKKDGDKKDSPEEDDSDTPTAQAPRGGVWVAGVAAALAVMLGGLWVVGRTRRKV